MPLLVPRQDFHPSCPSGGQWYSCGGGARFVGCCTTDPCDNSGCAAGNLRPASFNADYYGNFSDAECDSGLFYTCAATDPPFLGCCRENACRADGNAGCPQASLTGAYLPNNDAKASFYSPTGGPSATASSTASASSSDSSSTTAAIAGGVVGAVVVIVFVIGALLWRRRRKRKEADSAAAVAQAERPVSELAGTNPGTKGSSLQTHPPRYSSLAGSAPPMELDGYPRKSPHDQQTPSELGTGDTIHAELPGDDSAALHELEGSSPSAAGGTLTGSSSSPSKKGGGAAHSRGSSYSSLNSNERQEKRSSGAPRGLNISGLHPYSQVGRGGGGGGGGNSPRTSPRSSPRSPNFPARGGEGGGGDDAGSESGVSSLPSTPRSAYGYGPGAGTQGGYSDVSRLSPTYPPPIREDERGEERYRDDDDDDDDEDDERHDGYEERRR